MRHGQTPKKMERAARRQRWKQLANTPPVLQPPLVDPESPFILEKLPDPGFLVRIGPLVRAAIAPPQALRNAAAAGGRSVPKPIRGLMMLDTGAGDTCISTAVAQELGLQPIRTQRIFGVGGQKDHPVFLPEIIIELKQVDGHGFTMNRSQPAAGVDELEKLLEPISLARSDGWPTRLMGLLGRDFLRHMIMVYSGDAAEFRLFAQLGTLRAS